MPELANGAAEGFAELQAWLQARISNGLWDLGEDARAADIDARVASSNALSARDRVAIYAVSYVARLAECLRAEFPVLKGMIGEAVFSLFAGGYLSAHPPTSYSLYDLGAGFADYLAATRPPGGGDLAALPADLARLERAISESSRAVGPETACAAPFEVAPFEVATALLAPATRLRVPATVRLLRLGFDFADALATVRAGDHPAPPPARETLTAVARSRYVVRVHVLEPWALAWLEALVEDGDVQRAIQGAADVSGRRAPQIIAALTVWLPFAMEAGLISL